VVRSQREVVDTSASTDPAANGGAPGTQSNATNSYQQAGGAGGASNTQHKETTQNYEIAKSVDTITKAPGSVKRLTVSVVLDTAIPPEQVAQLKPAIEAAVGMDPKRGDAVQIASVPFDHTAADAEAQAAEASKAQAQTQQYISLAKTFGLPALAILVIGGTLFMATRGRKGQPQTAMALAQAGTLGAAPFETVVTEVVNDVRLPPELERRKVLREHVTTLAREDPQVVTAVVKGWLQEDGR
jgi:flagellar M-ring protein FliF